LFLEASDKATGPSSNIAFIRHISAAVARKARISQTAASTGIRNDTVIVGGMMSISRPPSPTSDVTNRRDGIGRRRGFLYELPPDAVAVDLINCYFSDTGLLFPYLHHDSFLRTYENMKRTRFSKIRRTWLGLLNMVFAMATSTAVDRAVSVEKRTNASDVFYHRALNLCDKQIMRGASLEAGK
jgi:hypothetical protein